MSDAGFDTGGVLGADFTSLLVLFIFLDTTVAAAAGAATDAGALVGVGISSDDTVSSTKGAGAPIIFLMKSVK
jgi:hypothetical protein